MNNPLILRYRSAHSRSGTTLIYGGVYLLTLLLMVFWARPGEEGLSAALAIRHFCTFYTLELWVVEVCLLTWIAARAAMVIPVEIQSKSYDFLRLVPLSPSQKVLGIIVGVNLPLLYLLISTVILLGITSAFGQLGLENFAILQTLTLLSGGLVIVLGFLSSTGQLGLAAAGKASAIRLVGMAFLVTTVLPALITIAYGLTTSEQRAWASITVALFQHPVPVYLILALHLAYLTGVAYLASLRRMNLEEGPIFSQRGALYFNLPLSFSALALTWPPQDLAIVEGKIRLAAAAGWVTALCIGTFMFSLLSASNYLDERARQKRSLFQVAFSTGNLKTGALLFLPSLLVLLAGLFFYGVEASWWMSLVVVILCGYLTLGLLLEMHVMMAASNKHPTLIIGFLLFIYLFFPAMTAIQGGPGWLSCSAISLYFLLLGSADQAQPLIIGCLFWHLIYALAAFTYIRLRYRTLERMVGPRG